MPSPELQEIVELARREQWRGRGRGRGRLESEEAEQMEACQREASASGLLGLLGYWVPAGGSMWSASRSTWFFNRSTGLSVAHAQWPGEPKKTRTLRRGGWLVTPPRGVCGALYFLWGDASSALRLRAPGSRGWELTRCAYGAVGASCARAGVSVPPVLAMHPTPVASA